MLGREVLAREKVGACRSLTESDITNQRACLVMFKLQDRRRILQYK